MLGTSHSGQKQYAAVGVQTGVVSASPTKLIVMLYDGAILACYSAIKAMGENNYEKKGMFISKAIMIIESGLQSSLDKEVGDIAEALDSLYVHMIFKLYNANVDNNPKDIEEVVALLKELRSAWQEIEVKAAT